MILIAHRGNLTGKNPKEENRPDYIESAIQLGFDCEIDLRTLDHKLFLGHDGPDYPVTEDFLHKHQHRLWIHCKDLGSLVYCVNSNLHAFWHEEDAYTLTSKKYIWAYPGQKITSKYACVTVMPERHMPVTDIIHLTSYGICSDLVLDIKQALEKP